MTTIPTGNGPTAAATAPQNTIPPKRGETLKQAVNSLNNFGSSLSPERLAELAEREARIREQQAEEWYDQRWQKSDVPRRHSQSQPPLTGPWGDACKRLAASLGTGFLFALVGPRGTGKTQIGVQTIHEACKNKSARYVKAIDVFIELRSGFRDGGQGEGPIIEKFVSVGLLVIDAMEERGETDFENRLLNHIIDKRYDRERDTLLISNQTSEEFSKSVGASIISRAHQCGGAIECNWPSFRKPKA